MTPTSFLPAVEAPPAGRHDRVWPAGVPRTLAVPDESLWWGLARRAHDTPDAVGLHFLGRELTWRELHDEALHLAGALQALGVARGDRVLLFMQNCPQFVIAFHAVLRAGAVVVPVNPMNKADELGHYIVDAGARVALASADIAGELARADAALPAGDGLQHLVVFDIVERVPDAATLAGWPPAWRDWLLPRPARAAAAAAPHAPADAQPHPPLEVHEWSALLGRHSTPSPLSARGTDLALLPYTSGTTGLPKGCMHTHASLLHNALSAGPWLGLGPGDTVLVVVPLFHITGLVMGLLAAIQLGAAVVLLPRWDRQQAAQAIARHRVTHWPNIPTMVIDLLAAPDVARFDLRSLRYIGGGGAPMPDAVAARLHDTLGLTYLEGYGLTETAAPTHTNPPGAARRQCLGIPYVSTEARVIDPLTLAVLPPGEVGEIVVRGPQLFQGYWRQAEATAEAFLTLDGRAFFRTGDLGRVDEDGYYHLADRLKRMINASGFKVWPAEVESLLLHHPGVQEACVIALRDAYRGESVKAVVVARAGHRDTLDAPGLIAWAREHMAVYKVPRAVEFVDALPRSAAGKVLWRVVQEREEREEREKHAAPPPPRTPPPG